MSYKNPEFMVPLVAPPLPISALNVNASTMTNDAKRAMIDNRPSELGEFTTTAAFGGFYLDFAGTSSETVNCVVIPAGHSFAGETVSIISGPDVPGFVSRASDVFPAGVDLHEFEFTTRFDDVLWGIQVVSASPSDVFAMGEFAIGWKRNLNSALNPSHVDPGFKSEYRTTIKSDQIGASDVTVELAPPRKHFSLDLRWVVPGSNDWDTIEEVIRYGETVPFWYWPPDDADPGPYLVKLSRAATRRQESVAPQATVAYAVSLEMTEQA